MTNLFETDPVHPSELHAGCVVYYADAHTYSNEYLHGLQTTKVSVSDEKSFILDNGKRFNPITGKEITRGNGGYLYPYTPETIAMVQNAQSKLFLVNEVASINFSKLTTQQLSMILDVSRGAFTQVSYGTGGEVMFSNPSTSPSPCGGGCSGAKDTVEIAGLDIEVDTAHPWSSEAKYQPADVSAPTAFTDASYELTEAELDDIEDADDEDDDLEDRCASGHTA